MFKDKLLSGILKTLKVVTIIIFLYVLILNVAYSSFTFSSWYPLIYKNSILSSTIKMILGISLIGILIWIAHSISKKTLIILTVLINISFLIFKLFIANTFGSIPVADSFLILESANAFVYNSSYIPEYLYSYLMHIPRQLGIASILIPLVKLFQYNFQSLLFFQSFMIQVSLILITVSIYKLKGIKSAFLSSLLMNIFIPNSFLTLLIYGDTYALFFLSLSFFFYSILNKKYSIYFLYISLILAYFARTTTNIWILAGIVLVLINLISKRDKFYHLVILISILIFPYMIIAQVYSGEVYHFNDNYYPNNTWLRIGLGYSGFDGYTPGYYNDQIERDFIKLNQDTTEMEAYNSEIIQKNLSDLVIKNELFSFLNTKLIISWTDSDFEMMTRLYPFLGEKIENPYLLAQEKIYGSASMVFESSASGKFILDNRDNIVIFEKVFLFGILIYGLIILGLSDKKDNVSNFIRVLIVGVFFFNLMFEVKGRYNFVLFNALIIYVAYHHQLLVDRFVELKEKIKLTHLR